MKTILVIEPDTDILALLECLLGTEYIVHTSPISLSIPEIVAVHPDLIVLDHWSIDCSANELSLALKANPVTAPIPVILLSTREDIVAIAADSAADAGVIKPFDIKELIAVIQCLV